MKYTQKQLEKDLSYWQKMLRLQDWTINVRITNLGELSGPAVIGNCRVYMESKTANIRIIDYDSWIAKGYRPDLYDPEDILVHELFHIHFEFADQFLKPEEEKFFRVGLEQAFESITPALIKLKREAQEKKNKK